MQILMLTNWCREDDADMCRNGTEEPLNSHLGESPLKRRYRLVLLDSRIHFLAIPNYVSDLSQNTRNAFISVLGIVLRDHYWNSFGMQCYHCKRVISGKKVIQSVLLKRYINLVKQCLSEKRLHPENLAESIHGGQQSNIAPCTCEND